MSSSRQRSETTLVRERDNSSYFKTQDFQITMYMLLLQQGMHVLAFTSKPSMCTLLQFRYPPVNLRIPVDDTEIHGGRIMRGNKQSFPLAPDFSTQEEIVF